MGNLLTFSGITTKVKAMESRLISDDLLRRMAALENVSEAVDFLKLQPAYSDIFSNTDGAQLHRAQIEQLLTLSQYRDFAKLYRFSNLSQRKFLSLYFMHYEITILKKCLRNVLDHRRVTFDLSVFQEFFEKHSKLDLIRLSSSESISEFIANLEGSIYYSLLNRLENKESPTLFDYEMQLDLLYFKSIWSLQEKYLSKSEQAILYQCFGSKLDLLNLQWIYRSKKYYKLPPADIYALLIPTSYKLKKKHITKLTEAASLEEFFTALQDTYYMSFLSDITQHPDLEILYEQVLNKIHALSSRKNPYSIACLNSYLYFKELELHKIITTIESIRYGVPSSEIISYVIKN